MKHCRPKLPELTIDRHVTGMVKACPVVSWTAPAVAAPHVFLKVAWASDPRHLGAGDQQMQLILTQQQALNLADHLQRQVAQIRAAVGDRKLN
jgi:hypothetical protein